MAKQHTYSLKMTWTGNTGSGTQDYKSYERNHEILANGKPPIPGSSDPSFRGDMTRYNPEELLVGSLSSCHMLWFLHLCADAGIVVMGYEDEPDGIMVETANGGGHFTEVTLRPLVTITDPAKQDLLDALHEKAHHLCFIANSVNFPVRCEGRVKVVFD